MSASRWNVNAEEPIAESEDETIEDIINDNTN